MKITEAAKKANAGRGIRREEWAGKVFIIPTDTENCCEIYINGKFRSTRWNPKREDLIADDCTVCSAREAIGRIVSKVYDPAQLIR